MPSPTKEVLECTSDLQQAEKETTAVDYRQKAQLEVANAEKRIATDLHSAQTRTVEHQREVW